MKRKILIVAESDPAASPRTAEAVRIAAGVGTWERVEISIYFRGPAMRVLTDPEGDWIDREDVMRYWPMLGQARQKVYGQKGAAVRSNEDGAPVAWEEISDAEFARLAAGQDCVMRF